VRSALHIADGSSFMESIPSLNQHRFELSNEHPKQENVERHSIKQFTLRKSKE